MSDIARNYDSVAKTYELLGQIYSTGQIKAAKLAQLRWLPSGSKLLFLGCGSGEDVIAAAEQQFDVTALDISPKMLQRLQSRLDRRNLKAELVCQSIFDFQPKVQFDAVAANFFLNIFYGDELDRVIDHTLTMIKPEGCLLIADVALPVGWLPARMFNWCYINAAQVAAAMAGIVRLHRNHDYGEIFKRKKWEVSKTKYFRLFRVGPILFQSLKVVPCQSPTKPQGK